MSKTREEKLAYSRGYSAGLRGEWSKNKPIIPPEPYLSALLKAAIGVRDQIDAALGTIDQDDEWQQLFGDPLHVLDDALKGLHEWLRKKEHSA